MSSIEQSNLEFNIINDLESAPARHIKEAISIYRRAFAEPPYSEQFNAKEAREGLQYILDQNGDLILGSIDDKVWSLAGGYFISSGEYFIEELAVDPNSQGKGLGRRTLQELIKTALLQDTDSLELCTNTNNVKAISLYESEGFVKDPILKVGPHYRIGDILALDHRVYLKRTENEMSNVEKIERLNRVVVAYPSGNTTAIVLDQMLDSDRKELNNRITKTWDETQPDKPEIEQCCFVTLPKDESAVARVEMFGGEFCGNATRSVIKLITDGKDYAGKIEVSGVKDPLDFKIENGIVDLEMPLPNDPNVELTTLVDEGVLVQLDGIAHVVVTDIDIKNKNTPRELLKKLLEINAYKLTEQPAVGVTYYDPETSESDYAVWVKEVDTTYDETACGSGTCSAGIAMAVSKGIDTKIDVIQPSGETISTEAIFDKTSNKINESRISGEVSILFDGRYELK